MFSRAYFALRYFAAHYFPHYGALPSGGVPTVVPAVAPNWEPSNITSNLSSAFIGWEPSMFAEWETPVVVDDNLES